MILFDELSQEQTQIVKQICYIQLDSLRRIYNNNHHSDKDIINILIENEIDEASFTDKIEEKLNNFKHLNKNPNNLSKLNNSDLSMFRHILAQIEDDYKKTYPKAISNLWKRLFIIEDNRTVSNLN